MADLVVWAVGVGMTALVWLLLRLASRHLRNAARDAAERDERIAELIAHHWVDADLPDRFTDQVIACGGCNFTGPTRLHHARHIAAAIRRLDDADHRIAAQMQGRSP